MECYLSPSRLRFAIKCTCFGALLLWIVCGFYVEGDGAYGMRDITQRRPLAHYRRLLAVSKTDAQITGVDEDEGYLEDGSQHFEPDAECSSVHKLPSNQSCNFVLNVSSCQNEDGLINYLEFIYCKLPHRLIPLAMVVLTIWLIFMFIFLGATAEEYFCPSLKVISQVLHLSQNVARVTLLALGNGAPDIFSAFAAINQNDDHKASLAIGALFGAGIFVTTIVVGAVGLLKPFALTQRPFLRDVIFYTVAVYWTFYLLWKGSIDIRNAAGLVGLYVFYVLVVIVGRVVYQWWKKRNGKNNKLGNGDIPRPQPLPEGEEMDHSEPSSQTNLLDETPEDDKNENIQTPAANGYTSNESNTDTDTEPSNRPARHYRIMDIGSSDVSYSEHQTNTIINVTADDTISDMPVLLSKERRNELGRMNAPTPPIPVPSPGLVSPERRRVGSPYGAVFSDEENHINHRSDGARQPHTSHKPMRKTISGALDITEEVGAAFGIPHVPQVWEEVHRSHSRSHRIITEEGPQESHPAPPTSDEDAPLLMKPPPPAATPKRMHPFVKMLQAIWPFGPSFKSLGTFGKIYEILKSPISVMLVLTTPLVDSDEDGHNWNKWLNVFHCAIAPAFIVIVTKRGFVEIGGVFPVWALMLIVGFLVALVVALTSKNNKPPVYHCTLIESWDQTTGDGAWVSDCEEERLGNMVFAWIGFAVSVVWIYSIANEIVNLLQAFGVVLKISDGILGLTFLAWGNSIGGWWRGASCPGLPTRFISQLWGFICMDAVSNMAMARQGFPRMAIGACFGGPLLNMLLGVGIASMVKSVRRSGDGFKFQLYFTQVEFLASLFLVASLASSLIVITCLRFRLRRPYGIFLIGFYIVFLVISILAEVNVISISISGHVTADPE